MVGGKGVSDWWHPEPKAIDYLVKYGFSKDNAQQVVRELTGDRLSLLSEVRNMSNLNFEGMSP